jgi:AraC-like DNA-binding protein
MSHSPAYSPLLLSGAAWFDRVLSNVPIKHVAEELGYSSIQYFSKMFKKKFGVSPGLFTREAQD